MDWDKTNIISKNDLDKLKVTNLEVDRKRELIELAVQETNSEGEWGRAWRVQVKKSEEETLYNQFFQNVINTANAKTWLEAVKINTKYDLSEGEEPSIEIE